MTFRVLIADSLAEQARQIFEERNGVSVDDRAGISREELLNVIKDYDGLVVRSRTQADAELLAAGTELKVIGRAGIGVDNIDVRSATRAGVIVMNTPDGNAVTTAEHTISLILSMSRRIPQATASMKSGKWEKKRFMGRELCGKTLGVVGMGNIGRIVADRAQGLKLRVVAFDPYFDADAAARLGIELVSFEDLLARADVITVHTPLNAETRGLISDAQVEAMRRGVMLVNCARGGIYDEAALLKGLESGQIGALALDVFTTEPPDPDNHLLKHDRVICTPHLGASTEEAQVAVAVAIAEQICDFAGGEPARNALNLPRIAVSELRQLAPYLDLAERLGSFCSQLVSGAIKRIEVKQSGDLGERPTAPICAAALAGALHHAFDAPVNAVNATLLAEERGIDIIDARSARPESGYENTLAVTIEAEHTRSVVGTLFAGGNGRIVEINGVHLEAVPEGHMLVITNRDRPGVIGRIGTLLGDAGVNISRLQLGLEIEAETALSVVNIDDALSPEIVRTLVSDDVLSVTPVSL